LLINTSAKRHTITTANTTTTSMASEAAGDRSGGNVPISGGKAGFT